MSKGPNLKAKMDEPTDIATREEALRILTAQARQGSTTAAVALARELRTREKAQEDDFDAELAGLAGRSS